MMKKNYKNFLIDLAEDVTLYRDMRTGIAFVEDGTSGVIHSAHPNISATGSVAGMREQGYWGKKDRVVEMRGFIYNIDKVAISSALDEVAKDNCQCGGAHCRGGV